MTEPAPFEGHVQPTSLGAVVAWGVAGLVGGWLFRRVVEWQGGNAPVVTWLQVFVLFFVAAILAATAWTTWRTLHLQGHRLEPHRAVNRLVLAKASALVGALVAGGYAGYALSWVGLEAELAGQRILRSLLAGLAGLVMCIAALWLERACRVRKSDDDT